jgi:peptidyl-prolyl cis-trans isomerase SurA
MTNALLLATLLAAGDPAAVPAPAPSPPAGGAPSPGRVLNRVAATVNGDVVTLRDLEQRAGASLERVEALPPGPARERARADALRAAFDQLVAERLFEGQAAALGVEVGDGEVDAAIDEIKRRNKLDDDALDQALAQQGMDRASFRKAVKRDLESMRILQVKVRNQVKVTDEDVKAYWQSHPQEFRQDEEVRVRHVFLALPATAGAEDAARVEAKAARVLARARDGEDFAALARAESEGPSARDGGDLGWLRRGQIQAELEKVAFALSPGAVSGVVRTRAGLQIIKVEERRGGGARPFDEVKEEIRARLMNDQAESYRNQFVAELRKEATIDVRLPELREPAAPAGPAPQPAPRS